MFVLTMKFNLTRIHHKATISIYSQWNWREMGERVDECWTKFENFTNRNHITTFGVNLWPFSETKL